MGRSFESLVTPGIMLILCVTPLNTQLEIRKLLNFAHKIGGELRHRCVHDLWRDTITVFRVNMHVISKYIHPVWIHLFIKGKRTFHQSRHILITQKNTFFPHEYNPNELLILEIEFPNLIKILFQVHFATSKQTESSSWASAADPDYASVFAVSQEGTFFFQSNLNKNLNKKINLGCKERAKKCQRIKVVETKHKFKAEL